MLLSKASRAALKKTFRRTADEARFRHYPVVSSAGQYGTELSWPTGATTFAGRITSVKGDEVQAAFGVEVHNAYRLVCSPTVAIDMKDRIKDLKTGKFYSIVGDEGPQMVSPVVRQLILAEVPA